MTAYTLGAYNARLTSDCVEDNGLMTTIAAGNFATTATHALLEINLGIDDGVAIEIVGCYEHFYSFANQFGYVTNASLGHVALET